MSLWASLSGGEGEREEKKGGKKGGATVIKESDNRITTAVITASCRTLNSYSTAVDLHSTGEGKEGMKKGEKRGEKKRGEERENQIIMNLGKVIDLRTFVGKGEHDSVLTAVVYYDCRIRGKEGGKKEKKGGEGGRLGFRSNG